MEPLESRKGYDAFSITCGELEGVNSYRQVWIRFQIDTKHPDNPATPFKDWPIHALVPTYVETLQDFFYLAGCGRVAKPDTISCAPRAQGGRGERLGLGGGRSKFYVHAEGIGCHLAGNGNLEMRSRARRLGFRSAIGL